MSESSRLVNRILATLPQQEYQRLEPHFEPVSLQFGQILYEPKQTLKQVYFPIGSLVSLVSVGKKGTTTEVALIGYRGMVGIAAFLGDGVTAERAIVQMSDGAIQVDADIVKAEFERAGELQKLLLYYNQALFTQISQNLVSRANCTIKQQLASLLLLADDCTQNGEMLLTQQFISNILSTRRASISEAASNLSRAKIIRYSRGKITILNRQGLELAACSSYLTIKKEYARLLSSMGD